MLPSDSKRHLADGDFHKTIAVNQHGVAYGIIEAGRKVKELGVKGAIINTASVIRLPRLPPRNLRLPRDEGAVIMMSKSAALELAPHGIRVIAVAPGALDTLIIQADE
ncbi:SDR family oxidoreductase [Paenibacillus sp. D51F]